MQVKQTDIDSHSKSAICSSQIIDNVTYLSKAFDKVNLHALFIKLMKRNVPIQLLGLLENMLFDCHSCVKWENDYSDFFTVMFGVRQGSVLAPFLFAVFLDELSDTCNLDSNRFIIVYADDILLIFPFVV